MIKIRTMFMGLLALCALSANAQEPTPNSLFLSGDIQISIATSGEVTFNWATLNPAAHGRIFLGLESDVSDMPTVTYRRYGTVVGEADEITTEHSSTFNLSGFERDVYDVASLVENSGGTVHVRLVTWSPSGNRLETFHTRFAYQRDAEGNARRVPCIVAGPNVDMVTEDSAIISWETDMVSDWSLEYAMPLGSQTQRVTVPRATEPLANRIERKIEGLEPLQDVTYRVLLKDSETGENLPSRSHTFQTAPETGSHAPFSFAVMSDSRAGAGGGLHDVESTNWAAVRNLTLMSRRAGADLLIFAGDLVNGYTASPYDMDRQLHSWRNATDPAAAQMPIYEGMGNHEYCGVQNPDRPTRIGWAHRDENAPELIFSANFVNPTNGPETEDVEDAPPYAETAYSFDYGNAHFVSVNTNYFWSSDVEKFPGNREGFVMEGQMKWLDEDLAAARERGQNHLFVYTHEPMFPNGGHMYDAMYWHGRIPEVLAMRDEVAEILSRHGVLAIFTGDEHNYSRMYVDQAISEQVTQPFWQMVTGGAGAPYYGQQQAPWTDNVVSFAPINHYLLVEVDGLEVTLKAISDSGQVVDEANLVRDLPPMAE